MREKTLSKFTLNLALLIVVFVILFPVFYIVQTSLKSTADIYSGTFFFEAKTRNYEEIFTGSRSNFAELTRNSLIVSSSVALICGFIGSLAAYSISRLHWSRWVTGGILVWLLFINMMPPIVFVTPYYLWARAAGIYDTPAAVIMAHVVLNMPLAVIMMMNFFAEVPKELEEAAVIDGCTQWQAFRMVIVPIVRPGLAAMAVLVFRLQLEGVPVLAFADDHQRWADDTGGHRQFRTGVQCPLWRDGGGFLRGYDPGADPGLAGAAAYHQRFDSRGD